MKLLMITGLGSAVDLASGKKGAFYNTLEEFHKYWDRIDIISPRISRGSTSGGFEIEPFFGNVYVHVSPWPLVFHPFWFLKKGIQIYKEQKFDLMTVQEFPPFYNGIGACLLWHRIKVPYILEIFHIPGFPKASNLKESFYKFLTRLFIWFDVKRAKAVRVMNNTIGEFLISSGVPKEKIHLIPAIYVDLDIFKPMGLPKEYDMIFVGRLEKNKGLNLLIEIAKKTDLKILIVGNGPMSKYVSKMIGKWKLANLKCFGFAKDSREIAELLNKSKLLIMPSYNEGGPRVVVEAMACGVPVLATPVGIVSDLLKNGRGGEIIDWNSEDIAKKAEGLLNDSERYNKFSHEAVEMAKQFEKKASIKNYADKLKSLI